MEVEPIRYQLEIHTSLPEDEPQRTKKVVRSDVVLAKSSLFRFEEGKDSEARMQKVLSYEYEKSEYFGQVPGMLRGKKRQILRSEFCCVVGMCTLSRTKNVS